MRAGTSLLAYVLHHYDWSETSLIVELFTRQQGRVVVAARGAKRPTSQLRPVLLPFQPLLAHLGRVPADEQAEVRALRSAEWVGGAPLLAAAAMFPGFYLNELLLKLLARQDPHPALFDAYADTLGALASADDEAAALRAFELLLLRETGVLPDLSQSTLTAEPLQPAARYTLHAEAGVQPDAHGPPGTAWVALEAALAHGSAAALRQAVAPHAAALRAPLRAVLHYHLGHTPLRTRQVWQGVQQLAGTTHR
ncbi:MAG: DNA repair protein RecO [Rhodoferax sp.]|uniref:DNA repair protein RecO n=1 Tax=Rhodoferax sp. TaxID=50421 RepID=UPI00272FB5A7|nr:DNA repair protein RecO [Rhodoferax sp.]MDP1528649.1 DNA repair protein RecO [Rhodoferax sp.]